MHVREYYGQELSTNVNVEGMMLYTLKLRNRVSWGYPHTLGARTATIFTILVHCADRDLTAHTQESMISPRRALASSRPNARH